MNPLSTAVHAGRRHWPPSVAALLLAICALAACGTANAGTASATPTGAGSATPTVSPSRVAAAGPCAGTDVLKPQPGGSAAYVMTLAAGPEEAMYTPQEVASQHPTGGEVMLSGTMTMVGTGSTSMPGMSMSTPLADAAVRHLEVHICNAVDGAVVSGADPAITLVDASTQSAAVPVPVAVMQGVSAGPTDLHYGNNVQLRQGHDYVVTVSVGTAQDVFVLDRAHH